MAKRKAAPAAKPQAKAVQARAAWLADGKALDGKTTLDQLRQQFDADYKRWDSDSPDNEALDMAVGYWLNLPALALQVYWFPPKSGQELPRDWVWDQERAAAHQALVNAHKRATHFLMEAAERLGIDSGAIFEAAETCRQLCCDSKYIGVAIGNKTWPECLEGQRDSLPVGAWEAAQKGCATLARLSAKLGHKLDNGPWSKHNGPAQWAKWFGISHDTLMRRFKAGAIRHKKLSSKSYCIHVDDLPK